MDSEVGKEDSVYVRRDMIEAAVAGGAMGDPATSAMLRLRQRQQVGGGHWPTTFRSLFRHMLCTLMSDYV